MARMDRSKSCRRTRVEPVFEWLAAQGGPTWPEELLSLCDGLGFLRTAGAEVNGQGRARGRKKPAGGFRPGAAETVLFRKEHKVKASPERLAWMLRNADQLAPRDPRRWRFLARRVREHPALDDALHALDLGERKEAPRKLILEGPTRAACLIECERLVLWVEGTRNDWLKTSAKWDLARDQLARGLEAAWILACQQGKDCCFVLCHEQELKLHESALIEGYRSGTWSAGWPHLSPEVRRRLGQRIGTVTWGHILAHWPEIAEAPELANVAGVF
jgi:hypothetical protein